MVGTGSASVDRSVSCYIYRYRVTEHFCIDHLVHLVHITIGTVVNRIISWFSEPFFSSVFTEEHPPIREEDALAKWASDPANTAWMESKE